MSIGNPNAEMVKDVSICVTFYIFTNTFILMKNVKKKKKCNF